MVYIFTVFDNTSVIGGGILRGGVLVLGSRERCHFYGWKGTKNKAEIQNQELIKHKTNEKLKASFNDGEHLTEFWLQLPSLKVNITTIL